MTTPEFEKCSKCHAPIIWCATVNGKMQPIDAEPRSDGNLRLLDEWRQTQRGALQRVQVIPKAELDDQLFPVTEDRYYPHHASCPHAEDFRKPKKETA